MITLNQIIIILYTTIVVSLIWARFRFFTISATSKKLYVYLYDSAAGLQIAATYYLYVNASTEWNSVNIIIGLLGYSVGLGLFWWSISTAKKLDFAFTPRGDSLITKGPYAFVRHPFYSSYALTWITSTFLFNNPMLWITLSYMMAYYYLAAKSEEGAILTGEYSHEYRLYSQTAGMFLPRIKKWKK